MTHYIVELAIWVLLAYFLGCFIGALLRNLFGSTSEPADAVEPVAVPAPVESTAAVEPEPVAAATEPVMSRMERPKGLAEARGGKPDNLQRISGIGPKNERVLHNLGFFHFDQLAAWTGDQIAWVDEHLKFNGRIGREQWVRQAKLLANGEDAEFLRLFGAGQPKG
jgi:predicted flap endonuclease-1-like 5' DNA nuclease